MNEYRVPAAETLHNQTKTCPSRSCKPFMMDAYKKTIMKFLFGSSPQPTEFFFATLSSVICKRDLHSVSYGTCTQNLCYNSFYVLWNCCLSLLLLLFIVHLFTFRRSTQDSKIHVDMDMVIYKWCNIQWTLILITKSVTILIFYHNITHVKRFI